MSTPECALRAQAELLKVFEGLLTAVPEPLDVVVAISPGRVNLIGEHIDYNGFGVLPCALSRVCVVAGLTLPNLTSLSGSFIGTVLEGASERLPSLLIVSTEPSRYPCATYIFDYGKACPVPMDRSLNFPPGMRSCGGKVECYADPSVALVWADYVAAGFLCGRDFAERHGFSTGEGLTCIAVSGDLPDAAGLSSSSALVVSSSLCAAGLLGLCCDSDDFRRALAQHCSSFERLVGTAGGGMDQAAILLAREGCCSHILFDPLRVVHIPFPPEMTCVVINSCVRSEKAETVKQLFNRRVLECRLASLLLQERLLGTAEPLLKLAAIPNSLGVSLMEMRSLVETTIHAAPFSLMELRHVLGDDLLNAIDEGTNALHDGSEEFALLQPARHVYSEGARVEEFNCLCKRGCTMQFFSGTNEAVRAFGSRFLLFSRH